MLIHNTDVAVVFNQIADLLEIKGDNPFHIRAYRNAARMLNSLATSVQTMVEEGRDLNPKRITSQCTHWCRNEN